MTTRCTDPLRAGAQHLLGFKFKNIPKKMVDIEGQNLLKRFVSRLPKLPNLKKNILHA